MSDDMKPDEQNAETDEKQLKSRRDFLKRLGRWSAIIIGGAALGGMMAQDDADASGWVNRRGGGGSAGWVNKAGGGGGAWVNGGGGGGGSWVNRGGGWINGGGAGWVNRRSSWVNRS